MFKENVGLLQFLFIKNRRQWSNFKFIKTKSNLWTNILPFKYQQDKHKVFNILIPTTQFAKTF